jgi:hypothetical protein
MELHELSDRLFRLHAKLIIVLFLAGLLGGLLLQWHQTPKYQAKAQLVIGAEDPQSAQNAAVLADTARAIATGPALVDKAIAQAGVTRDEAAVAAAVNVQSVGSSGVLALTVTDPDPRVAAELANSLAAGVVSTRASLARGGLAASLTALTVQEAAIRAQIRQLSSQAATLSAQLPNLAFTSEQAPAIAQLTAIESRLTSLQDQATQIALQRSQLATTQQGPTASVLDNATTAVATGGRGLIDPVLGALLGLVAGIAAAAIAEIARPHLVGAAAISKAIGTPLLGEMGTPPDRWTRATLPDAGSYIELAADAQQVREVRFAALDPNGRRRASVLMLKGPKLRGVAAASRNGGADGDGPPRTGLVVAVPRILKVADIDAVTNFIWISGWTLLGVIVFPAKRRRFAPARRRSGPDGSRRDEPVSHDVEVQT